MSRKGNYCYSAVTETFFGTLKTEHMNHETYKNVGEARMSLFQCIEGFYNHKCRHSTMGNVSPSQFEEILHNPCPFYGVQVKTTV